MPAASTMIELKCIGENLETVLQKLHKRYRLDEIRMNKFVTKLIEYKPSTSKDNDVLNAKYLKRISDNLQGILRSLCSVKVDLLTTEGILV